MEAIPFCGSRSFQWKPFPLVETIPFNGSHFFQQKPFFLNEAITFSGGHSFQWKPFLLVKANPFSGNHSFQFFPQNLFFFGWKSLPVVETNLFRKSIFFLVEAWWKLLLLIETRNFSFQWKPFLLVFHYFHQQKLSEVTCIIKNKGQCQII